MSRTPHIVLFNPDQWRGDVLSHLGNAAAVTPNIDGLVAREAVSFRLAFAQNPVCTPSRASFMSGWYPHVRGHRTMTHMLRPGEPVLLETLKKAGYHVWWGGKNDLIPAQLGFETYCDVRFEPPGLERPAFDGASAWRGAPGSDTFYSFYAGRLEPGMDIAYLADHDKACIEAAVEHIRSAPRDRPLCVFLSLFAPHPPYAVEEPWFSKIDRSALPPRIPPPGDWSRKPAILSGLTELLSMHAWREDRWDELRATYHGICARVDHQFGMVLDALRDAGTYDDTAVFFFSDHGDFTGDYGLVEKTQNTFEDVLVRVPLVVKPPRSVPVAPRVSEALVELIDLPATVEALAGIAPRHTHFGRSLLDVIAGTTDEHREAVFAEGGRLHGETQAMEHGAQDPRALYWPRLHLQRREGPEHGKAVMCRTRDFKYIRRLYEPDELYDLRSDPRELDNRIDDPALVDVRLRLQDRMLTFFLETGDVVPFDLDRRR